MEKIYGFLKKRELTPVVILVCSVGFIATIGICTIDYRATYGAFLTRLPQDVAFILTVFTQVFEFLIPILTILGVLKFLEVSNEINWGIKATWLVVLILDFGTAYMYLIQGNPDPQWGDQVIAIGVSLLFLFIELFVVLSAAGLIMSISYYRTGNMPGSFETMHTLERPSLSQFNEFDSAPEDVGEVPNEVIPIGFVRNSADKRWEFWKCSNGETKAYPKGDPCLPAQN